MQRRIIVLAASTVLGCASALAAGTTPLPYAYSASIAVSVPKNSAGEANAKLKGQPTATRFTPCNSGKDQLLFTLKYDAGKDSTSPILDTYVLFRSPGGVFFTLARQQSNAIGPVMRMYPTVAALDDPDPAPPSPDVPPNPVAATQTYTAAANYLGGLKNEALLGGELALEGLEEGIWMVSAIVADSASVKFGDPATWKAWDTATFMVGKPWTGTTPPTTCN